MFKRLRGYFSSDLSIDLGTANTLVFARGKGIVVNEPSIVAINKNNGEVEAVGKEAKEMVGRTPGNIVAIRPMKDGVIADFKVTERMLNYFIHKAHGRKMLVHPRIIIGVPSEITQVEKRAVIDSAYRAKASEVVNVDGTFAEALLDDSASLELLAGTGEAEAALLVRSTDGVSVVLTEVIFDLPPPKSAVLRAALKLAGFGPGPVVTPVVKFELVNDKAQLAAHLERLADIPRLTRLIVAHSRMSVGPDAADALRQAAARL